MPSAAGADYVEDPRTPAVGHRTRTAQLGDPLSDIAPSLAPRSAGAIADTELLRVAITDVGGPGADAPTSLAGRIRSFLVRFTRSEAEPA
jgi:hypothetical protein